jgi:shikimate dehydrogenase
MNEPRTFLLLGRGIAYSASPTMMAAAFGALGLPHSYVLRDIPEEDVISAVDAMRADPSLGGANVTTPHKVAVAAAVDELSPRAALAGAVNTIVRRDDGGLVGHNTDIPAIAAALRRIAPNGPGRAVILGAGGAARGVELALAEWGASAVQTLRRSDGSWSRMEAVLRNADLAVNATPVGTHSDDSPVPADLHRPDLAVLDLVYRPSPTRLVRDARTAGARAEAGAGVLLDQGVLSLELWLRRPAPRAAMAAALSAELGTHVDVGHALEPVHA